MKLAGNLRPGHDALLFLISCLYAQSHRQVHTKAFDLLFVLLKFETYKSVHDYNLDRFARYGSFVARICLERPCFSWNSAHVDWPRCSKVGQLAHEILNGDKSERNARCDGQAKPSFTPVSLAFSILGQSAKVSVRIPVPTNCVLPLT